MKVSRLKIIATVLLFTLNFSVFCQQETELAHETELPRKEYRPYFKLITYSRGFDKDSLDRLMNYLIEKPSKTWSRSDSIDYIFALCSSGDYDLSFVIFSRLNLNDLPSFDEYHAVQHLLLFKRRYSTRREWLQKEMNSFPSSSDRIAIRQRITDVHELLEKREWSLEDSVIFPNLKDEVWSTLKKGSPDYIKYVIPTCVVIDEALRDESKYENTYNRALSLAFVEFGDFLEDNVSLTDAYITYSIARYYDRYNNEIANKLRTIKTKISNRNYLLPSIREIFPKKDKGLFNFQKIMDKRRSERDSVNQKNIEPLKIIVNEEKEGFRNGVWDETIMLAGLVLILLGVIIFVRVQK